MSDSCFACGQNAAGSLPPREDVVHTRHWRVAHAFDTSLPGWLVVVARTHVLAIDELDPAAHAELGVLVGDLSAALRGVVGCEKTYVMQFSEADGFAHLHVHVVPRMPDQPADRRGPAVFGYLGVDEADRISESERDRIAGELRRVLADR